MILMHGDGFLGGFGGWWVVGWFSSWSLMILMRGATDQQTDGLTDRQTNRPTQQNRVYGTDKSDMNIDGYLWKLLS